MTNLEKLHALLCDNPEAAGALGELVGGLSGALELDANKTLAAECDALKQELETSRAHDAEIHHERSAIAELVAFFDGGPPPYDLATSCRAALQIATQWRRVSNAAQYVVTILEHHDGMLRAPPQLALALVALKRAVEGDQPDEGAPPVADDAALRALVERVAGAADRAAARSSDSAVEFGLNALAEELRRG